MPNDIIDFPDPQGSGQTLKYIKDYEEGDLIYGLAANRTLYVAAVMVCHAVEKAPRVIMVDDMNNQFLGTNAPATANQKKLGADGSGSDYTPNAKTSEQGAVFHALLRDKVKTKWQPQHNTGPDKVNQRIKSASNAGILWTTAERKNKVHFILDGLDMEIVTGKLDFGSKTVGRNAPEGSSPRTAGKSGRGWRR